MFPQIFLNHVKILDEYTFSYKDQNYSMHDILNNTSLQYGIFGNKAIEFSHLNKREKNRFLKDIQRKEERENKVDYSDRFIILSDILTGTLHCFEISTKKIVDTNAKVLVERRYYPEKKIQPARIVFDPFKEEGVIGQDDILDCVIYNIYIKPDYQREEIEAKENPLILKFIEHLIPNEEHRKWFLAWTYNAIMDRNETIPILLGRQGTGKNTLIEGILFPLIGDSHIASASLLRNKVFNAELINKRIVFYDEIALPKSSVNRLKSYTNSYLPLEKKGQEVVNLKNHASFIGAGNLSEGKIYTTADERRLSFIDIYNGKLTEKFSKEEIDYLNHGFKKDLNAQRYFYKYLSSIDFTEVDTWIPVRGKQYYRCLFNSFDFLIRTLIYDFVLLDQTIDYKNLVRHYKVVGGTNHSMQSHLIDQLNQFHLDGITPCYIKTIDNGPIVEFVPNPEFVRKFKFLAEKNIEI